MNCWQSEQKQNLKGGEGEWNLNLNLVSGMPVGVVSQRREGGGEHSRNLLSGICSQRDCKVELCPYAFPKS